MTASPHAWANIRLSLYGLMRQRCNSLTVFVSITVIAADGVSDFGCTLANRSLSKTLVWADLFTPGRFWSGKLFCSLFCICGRLIDAWMSDGTGPVPYGHDYVYEFICIF
ncbi:hypothetical protein ASPFODRAFT_290305 [Aspergillus luchuensis CBS 106.47]|uniref:Uncharacterized protein n=1 Tax=Aspergillus luchuensis (strain CBS 106.47) TaxID=1137211 RepID=A0A1M3TAR0_ASPLC|nr:hypothetical protein ASPFODRAFT_290305 [Aspergillus luchuensis CBS 106.47]